MQRSLAIAYISIFPRSAAPRRSAASLFPPFRVAPFPHTPCPPLLRRPRSFPLSFCFPSHSCFPLSQLCPHTPFAPVLQLARAFSVWPLKRTSGGSDLATHSFVLLSEPTRFSACCFAYALRSSLFPAPHTHPPGLGISIGRLGLFELRAATLRIRFFVSSFLRFCPRKVSALIEPTPRAAALSLRLALSRSRDCAVCAPPPEHTHPW